jgi:hypothetical protein
MVLKSSVDYDMNICFSGISRYLVISACGSCSCCRLLLDIDCAAEPAIVPAVGSLDYQLLRVRCNCGAPTAMNLVSGFASGVSNKQQRFSAATLLRSNSA